MWTLDFRELSEYSYLLENLYLGDVRVVTIICLCLFWGACGKSAQFPLYVWLPDAMAGPTPVSALIHAATMVTAGVYMIVRLEFLFVLSPFASLVIAFIGSLTAFFAATIGLVQNDIKKVLAYSTVSQLGYMFLALGVGAYSTGIFHVMTHAFFKALLFLGAGSVILGMHHEQNIEHMGGLRKKMPWTYYTFLMATLALLGIFPFSGFFSKDAILWAVFSSPRSNYAFWIFGVITAGITSFYMIRLFCLTFLGKSRGASHVHEVHESSLIIIIPLMLLAVLSIMGGFVGIPHVLGGSNIFGSYLSSVTNDIQPFHYSSFTEIFLMIFVFLCVATLAYGAYYLYIRKPAMRHKITAKVSWLYRLLYHNYFVDELYDHVLVRNVLRMMRSMARFDTTIVDGAVNLSGHLTQAVAYINGWLDTVFVDGLVNGVARIITSSGNRLRRMQTGYIQDYVYVLFASIIFILLFRVMIL
jgi:NADH-quinone oxidoreductase subunit L